MAERVRQLGLEGFDYEGYPVVFWDVFGEQGHPVRTTISELGPLLLSRILNLNETQSGVLTIAFKIADDHGLLLLDLKDLQVMIQYVGDQADQFQTRYGHISKASVGTIQRGLLTLEQEGGAQFFGEPALDIQDLIQTDGSGKGVINIMTADRLLQSPKVYATLLLWMLSELFERLPEVGDPEKPKLVYFFDEAHLLFEDIPKALQDKIEQVVRLIRSKGVGVYFVTQNPLDIPEEVLGQLGNRVQHALRAFTPKDQKAVKAAAETFRPNPPLNVSQAITELKVGDPGLGPGRERGAYPGGKGTGASPPKPVDPPGPGGAGPNLRGSVLYEHYDRESAYEKLKKRAERQQIEEQEAAAAKVRPQEESSQASKMLGAMAQSAAHAIGSQIGRQIIRGVLGSIFGSGRKR